MCSELGDLGRREFLRRAGEQHSGVFSLPDYSRQLDGRHELLSLKGEFGSQ